MQQHALDLNDQTGKKTRLSLWFTPGNDVFGYLAPGDALFFHPNLLHCSEAYLSEHPRWSLISCYCSQSNLAYNETIVSWKTPVQVVPDEAILEWETASLGQADFLKKENDPALKDTGWEK